jgi:hypothetical protein
MAESYNRGGLTQSAGNLPKLRTLNKAQDEMTQNRNRMMHIHDELEDLQGQRQQIDQKLKRIGELEAAEHEEYLHLVSLRKQRKELEVQSQAVSNRIEHLKNLKDDLWKRIRYMHSCASEIENLKRKNEERKKEKEHAKLANEKNRLQKGNVDTKGKTTLKINLTRRKELMEFQKKERAEELRKLKQANERKYQSLKRNQLRENELRRKEVNIAEFHCTQYKDLFLKQKREKVLNRLIEDKKKEKFIIKKFQKDIDSLRRKEDDWMAEVRETEKMFFKANDRLKKVMNIEDGPQSEKDEMEQSLNAQNEGLPNDDDDDPNELVMQENLPDDQENSHHDLSGNPISVE